MDINEPTNASATDQELLREYARDGSGRAFEALVARYVDLVYSTALRQVGGDPHRAGEVTQIVFGNLSKKASSLAAQTTLAGWLYTSARWAARKLLRAERRRAQHERAAAVEAARENESSRLPDAARETITGGASDADTPEWEQVRPLLDDAMAQLGKTDREAVLLRFFRNQSFAEVGTRLGLGENAARMRVHRALDKLRERLARRGVTSSATALGAVLAGNAVSAAPAGMTASVSAGATSAATAAAGASAGVVSVAGAILAFMTSAKIITTAAIAVILVAAGGVYHGVQNERVSAASLAQARQESKNLAEQVRTLEKQNAAASSTLKITAKDLGNMFMDAHPEIREKLIANGRANGAYWAFQIAKALNLSPEQSEQLAELYARQLGGYGFPISGYGMVVFDPFETEESRNMNKIPDEMRALLGGDANYEKAQHLLTLTMSRTSLQSRELTTRLYLTDTPLTSQQALGIDEISYDLDKNLPKDTEPEARWKLFQERAKSVLSPEQMQAFSDVGDGYIYNQTLSKEKHPNVEDALLRATERTKSK